VLCPAWAMRRIAPSATSAKPLPRQPAPPMPSGTRSEPSSALFPHVLAPAEPHASAAWILQAAGLEGASPHNSQVRSRPVAADQQRTAAHLDGHEHFGLLHALLHPTHLARLSAAAEAAVLQGAQHLSSLWPLTCGFPHFWPRETRVWGSKTGRRWLTCRFACASDPAAGSIAGL
jgi:hypothetical protein